MASSSLSNLSLSLPLSSERKNTCSKPLLFRYPPLLKPIKAMGAEGRENLDHLQKVSRQQAQPKKRVAQVAPLGLWDRFPTARTVQQMIDTMEKVMEDPYAYGPSSSLREDSMAGYRRGRTPWEIKEGEDEYKMRFDMPGMTKKDVKVWVEDKILVLKAEKLGKKKKQGEEEEVEEEEEEEEWSAKSYGRYSSRIALPENVELDKIKAEVRDGVLYVTIPKARALSKVLDIDVQ